VNDEHDDRTEEFLVTLGGGGGPVPFHQALARKFRELALWRSYCAILSPIDRPMHYVQAMVTAAGVRVESVGSRYLQESDEDDLTADQVATLEALGWLAPPDDDDPEWLWPYNWWRELSGFGAIDDAAALWSPRSSRCTVWPPTSRSTCRCSPPPTSTTDGRSTSITPVAVTSRPCKGGVVGCNTTYTDIS
jgi:hypothetical protein